MPQQSTPPKPSKTQRRRRQRELAAGRRKGGYGQRIHERKMAARAAGLPDPCECWDCLRADGITVHGSMRDRHKGMYPPAVFREERHMAEGQVVKTNGHPVPQRRQDDAKHQATTSVDRAHLREAVANRAVI